MGMQIFSARVRGGTIVPEDGMTLPEGAQVTVIAGDAVGAVEVSPEEERELLAAIAEAERGETVRAAEVLERLRR
jgi:hypothetical protein